jgi:hypothetical protein
MYTQDPPKYPQTVIKYSRVRPSLNKTLKGHAFWLLRNSTIILVSNRTTQNIQQHMQ